MTRSGQTTIEINGRKYNAHTGELLKSIDSTVSKTTKAVSAAGRGTLQDISRSSSTAVSRVRRTTERSQTLIRQAVKKPAKAAAVKKVVNNQAMSEIKAPSHAKAKPIITKYDKARLSRAQSVEQSKLVSKFSGASKNLDLTHPQKTAVRHIDQLAVKPAPKTASKQTAPVRPAGRPTSPAHSILEQGLKNAQSHNQKLATSNKKTKSGKKSFFKTKVASYSAGALAFLLLTGFFAYQNIPNLSMRYASARSGITASIPGYQPSGFSLSNKIQYNPGQITLNFSSNSDDRDFSITQRETSWNSDALLSGYVSTKTDQIQKYEDKGRTIFLYGDNSATWVNGGVWYDINGNSQLNSDQLIRIATSM